MKKTLLAAAMTLAAATTALADPVEGIWKTAANDEGSYLHVKVAACGSDICGTIHKAFDASGSANPSYENLGKKMIWDMGVDGGGAYSGGKIWAPDADKTYKSKMSLSGNTLKVKGCVSVVCRSQNWTRVN
ncbi:DUF2147 domain-containing protein [Shimia sp. R11_0]|uniref:DUF2147 domain-containing protein n=1 Tax=Shimia marina TaxID=321267 RepID=A0A0P1ES17_9RHOB|nr:MULTISPECIES: DUF2147 domain-containing protein [Shimia]MBO9479166.1 DUF2147 domain-containing protein [Shimia sp. R11_0]CUH53312.1 hypothetical protein SHM7688_02766 [Shimia marina]SFD80071.1 Uncharacterized conserved protein, DUF2147 family [Shimia marina]